VVYLWVTAKVTNDDALVDGCHLAKLLFCLKALVFSEIKALFVKGA
jgi:hypothetical protein